MLTSLAPTLTVAQVLRGDMQLASPPTIYFSLCKVVDDPNKTARDAAYVIESDAALAVKLLKITNSAFFGFPGQICSITQAITMIGTRELQNLALAAVTIERFSELPGQNFSMYDFWSRNLRSALIARELDALRGKHFADCAFLCGLIHDIGKLVLYRRIPELAREVDLLLQSQSVDELDESSLEQQIIGFDHFQVGAELCRLWKLPESVVHSISLHNYPDHIGQHAEIANIARFANQLSKIESPYDGVGINSFELTSAQISVILDKIHDEFEVVFKLFYPSV